MPKLWKFSVLVIALVVMTGCPAPPKVQPRVTPLQTAAPPDPVPILRTAPEPRPEPPKTNLPSVLPTPVKVPTNRWVSLNDWNKMRGLEPPTRFDNGWGTIFRSRSSAGELSLTMGSRVAYWNGMALALGFVPRLTNHQAFLHGLDFTKNLDPLLTMPSLALPKSRVVVIDPGHGGPNTGAKSILNNRVEKEFTLDWAMRLKPLLNSNGWNVLLTRTTDVDVSLLDRVQFAERANASLFVSLHFNSVDSPSTRSDHSGVETYCLTPTGMPSNLTRGYKDSLTSVYPNNAFDTQNLQYAVRLHQAMVQFSGRTDRGIRRARFLTVLHGQNRPAVLLEAGYLSDPEEAKLIASSSYRQKLAEAVAKALE